MIMVIVGLTEEHEGNNYFFTISAWILGGIISPICSSIVWIPQIIKLIRTKNQGNLSLAMFLLQTPGNAITILFQILYHQNITTWGTYVICLVEQSIIVAILLVFKWREYKENKENTDLEALASETIINESDRLL